MDKIIMIDYNSVKGRVYYAIGNKPLYIEAPQMMDNKVKSIKIIKEDKRLIEVEIAFEGELWLTIVAKREDIEIWYTSKNDEGGPYTIFSLHDDIELNAQKVFDDLKPKNL